MRAFIKTAIKAPHGLDALFSLVLLVTVSQLRLYEHVM
jgi:hypothetical protein